MAELRDPRRGLGIEAVVDPRSAALARHDTGLAQHLQVVGDRRLAHAAAIREVAGTDLAVRCQLLDDGEARRLRERLKDLHVLFHAHRIYRPT